MRKRIIQKLTMLAFVAMVGIPVFAQGGKFGSETNAGVATTIGDNVVAGDVFDLQELRYYVKSIKDGVLDLEVIGLSSQIAGATGDPSLLTSKWGGTVTIPHKLSAADVNRAAEISSIAANAFTTTVLYPTTSGGKNATDSKDNFTAAAALVTKIIIDYNADATAAAEIGANAFAGLTALTEVNNLTPGDKILEIPETSFSANVFKTAKLVVPSSSVNEYTNQDSWSLFYNVFNGSFIVGDGDGNGVFNLRDLLLLQEAYLSNDWSDLTNKNAFDIDENGSVNLKDYLLLQGRYVELK